MCRIVEAAARSMKSLKAARKVLGIWSGKGLLPSPALQAAVQRLAVEQPCEAAGQVCTCATSF